MAREHSQRANKLLDSLLCTAKDYLVAKNYRSIETPPFNVVYRGKPSGLYQGRLQTGVGYIQVRGTLELTSFAYRIGLRKVVCCASCPDFAVIAGYIEGFDFRNIGLSEKFKVRQSKFS